MEAFPLPRPPAPGQPPAKLELNFNRMPTAKQRCKEIRDAHYPYEERPAEVFQRRIVSLGGPDAVLVEIGCGRAAGLSKLMAPHFGTVYGVDPEITAPVQEGNVHLRHGFAEHLELPDQCADVVVSVDVLEHLADPVKTFFEFARVLRPGGRILAMTPNILHPPLLLARPLSHGMRQYLNQRVTGTKSEDTFPTFYRANTAGALRQSAARAGLSVKSIEHISNHPQYLMFSRVCYRIGIAVERNILNTKPFAFLRQYVLADFEKPNAGKKKSPASGELKQDSSVAATDA
jgi:SAM-dependent methyltransferase